MYKQRIYFKICESIKDQINEGIINENFGYQVKKLAFNKYIQESVFINKKDIAYRLNEWESGRENILFITGLSGSGKSTTAVELASKYNAIRISLDLFEHNHFLFETDESKLKSGDKLIKNFVLKKYGGEKTFNFDNENGYKEFVIGFISFLNNLLSIAEKDSQNRYIFEGIQLLDLSEDYHNKFKKYAVIIKGTSLTSSVLRRIKRDHDSGDYLLRHPWELIKFYAKHYSRLKKYSKKYNSIK